MPSSYDPAIARDLRRVCLSLAVAAATVLLAGVASPGAAGGRQAAPLDPERLGQQASRFKDETLGAKRARRAAARAAGYSGGFYETGTGERVRVLLSDSYAPNDSINQSYADFLASLPHGEELRRVTVYLLTRRQVRRRCGRGAAACYDPGREAMYVPGSPPSDGSFTVEDVVAHEYGHHIANNRRNPPWSAFDRGTKRWASHEEICRGIRSGRLNPNLYVQDPAEGFAEAYLVTAGGRWGGIVSRKFRPNARSRSLIRSDVRSPWSGSRTKSWAARLRRGQLARRKVRTPLDGRMTVNLNVPGRADFDLYLLSRRGNRVLKRSRGRGSKERIRHVVCGEPAFKVEARALRGRGRAEVTASRP